MSEFLFGCVFAAFGAALIPAPNTTVREVTWAQSVCQDNGGLKHVRAAGRLMLPAKAVCNNTAMFVTGEINDHE